MNDGIHLNGKGSELKGSLLIDALKKCNSYLKENPESIELNFENPIETDTVEVDTAVAVEVVPTKVIEKRFKKITYKVKSGDTLGEIAEKYNISIVALKKRNKLRTNKIKPNQILLIDRK
jgi:membrane-bound lytic murein transglycosylase D